MPAMILAKFKGCSVVKVMYCRTQTPEAFCSADERLGIPSGDPRDTLPIEDLQEICYLLGLLFLLKYD